MTGSNGHVVETASVEEGASRSRTQSKFHRDADESDDEADSTRSALNKQLLVEHEHSRIQSVGNSFFPMREFKRVDNDAGLMSDEDSSQLNASLLSNSYQPPTAVFDHDDNANLQYVSLHASISESMLFIISLARAFKVFIISFTCSNRLLFTFRTSSFGICQGLSHAAPTAFAQGYLF
jgi:hypothetical protein